tara:strand:+ start:1960 stop:2139 length:180 start_codon:yes stop_codon:yes gene_type:complete
LIGDKAYDSDQIDERLPAERDIELIARHNGNRHKLVTRGDRAATVSKTMARRTRVCVPA